MSCKDTNNNSFTMLSTTGVGDANGVQFLGYILSAPSNAQIPVKCTWTTASTVTNIFCEYFTYTGGSIGFKNSNVVNESGSSQTNVNAPSLTPNASGDLLYGFAVASGSGTITNTVGSTAGVWTVTSNTDEGIEYELSSGSGSTAINFTQSVAGPWVGGLADFGPASGPPPNQKPVVF
jgi:hypothetical protein